MTGITMQSYQYILEYAGNHPVVSARDMASEMGVKKATVQQYLSRLALQGKMTRTGCGRYSSAMKQPFHVVPDPTVAETFNGLHQQLPFADFCVYRGTLLAPLMHHLSINHAIYVETNRDTIGSVFSLLKEKRTDVFRQPNADIINDYVDLRQECVIVKPLVTESPLAEVDGIPMPLLEKLLVDILKDPDFSHLRGAESLYIYQTACSLYQVNTSKLLRYARRRGIRKQAAELINQATQS